MFDMLSVMQVNILAAVTEYYGFVHHVVPYHIHASWPNKVQ